MNFPEVLSRELVRRRARNPRYSLRAFARDLGTDHASLSQVLRGRRALSRKTIQKFGCKLGLSFAAISDACTSQHAESLLRLIRSPRFRPNSRWLATRSGLPVDAINTALHRLLHDRRVVLESATRWTALE